MTCPGHRNKLLASQLRTPAETRTPNWYQAKRRSRRVRMEGWRQKRSRSRTGFGWKDTTLLENASDLLLDLRTLSARGISDQA
jgi:hypothetical protein